MSGRHVHPPVIALLIVLSAKAKQDNRVMCRLGAISREASEQSGGPLSLVFVLGLECDVVCR